MQDGERITVLGSTGETYELTRAGPVYTCSCPAWQKQRLTPAQRTCKHLRAQLGEDHEARRLQAAPARSGAAAEPLSLRAHRDRGLATALERFPAVAARMREVYDMPLPRHLAYAAGFWLGLAEEEKAEAWSYFGCGPAGILDWFEDGGLERPALMDGRLHYRYRRDPPEFVTVFSGNSDGGHWGLWYDDPRELPRLIVFNYARDDASTSPCKPTLLASLRSNMADETWPRAEYPHLPRVKAWLEHTLRLELATHRAENIPPPPPRRAWGVAGMAPVIEGVSVPAGPESHESGEQVYKVLRERPDEAAQWIAEARRELAAGQPMRALFLGRELHWHDGDALREVTTALLIEAYRALGRDALAEVVRVHHQHRDLPTVDVYGPVPERLSPLAAAAREQDAAAIAALLSAGAPAEDVTAALFEARSGEALALIAPHSSARLLDERLGRVIDDLPHLADQPVLAAERAAVIELLFSHGASRAAALGKALAVGLGEMAATLAESVDPREADSEGQTALHHAAAGGSTALVTRLLARGADPEARDARGDTPRDRARALWQDRRADSLAVLALLSPPPPATGAPGPLAAGDPVEHPQFGRGVVESSEGEGAAQKLRISFPGAMRTLLARFVRRPV